MPRVALVGARRARQGLGPWVARDLSGLGIEIGAVLGTSSASVDDALQGLRDRLGIRPQGYTRLEELLARERLDALVILSPSETHEACLRGALEAGLHSLCEKPLIWGGGALSARGAALVDAFRSETLLLSEMCQWPWTLAAFRKLHPQAASGPPERFAMRLSPASRGLSRVGDCLPHPLSLLQALAPAPKASLCGISFERSEREPGGLRVEFEYRAGSARVDCRVELVEGSEIPRPAALEIDGRRAARRVQLPDYSMEFVDGPHSVPLPDPLAARLGAFASDLRSVLSGAAPPDPAPLAQRLTLLEALVEAYPGHLDEPAGESA